MSDKNSATDSVEDSDSSAPSSEDTQPGPDVAKVNVGEIELPVHFELATARVSIGHLSRIQEGYIFELPTTIDDLVSIRCSGNVVGKGKLVQVGDRLGVQVKEWD